MGTAGSHALNLSLLIWSIALLNSVSVRLYRRLVAKSFASSSLAGELAEKATFQTTSFD